MDDRLFRRSIFVILIVAAVLRLAFLFWGEVLPVLWDARRYSSAGIALLSYLDGVETSLDTDADRQLFKEYHDKYIQGESINWLFYETYTLSQAREELFFAGPLYPAFLAVIMYLAPVSDFTFVRLVTIGLDIISVSLLMLIAVRLVGRKASLLSGVIYAIYFPFILTSTMVLLETSTSFFLLLCIYLLIKGVETDNRRFFIYVGIISGMLVMHKPTSMFLGAPFIVGLYLYTRNFWPIRRFLKRFLLIAIPALIIFCSWVGVASAKYGELALRDPKYAGSNIRQSCSIEYEGYDLDTVEKEFWKRGIYENFTGQLPEYAGLFAKKFERMWGRPYNDFKRTLFLPYQVDEWLHIIIVIMGLFGLLTLLSKDLSQVAWPLLIIGYYLSIHLIFHSINRYSFNAMPMIMICAGYFIALLIKNVLAGKNRSRLFALFAIILLIAGWLISPSWPNKILDIGMSESMTIIVLTLKTAFWLNALWIYCK